MKSGILTVTLNPVKDIIVIPSIGKERAMAGGGGVNVARAIRMLGGEVHTCVLLSGDTGRWIEEQLLEEQLLYEDSTPPTIIRGEGETRICKYIFDPMTRDFKKTDEDINTKLLCNNTTRPTIHRKIWNNIKIALKRDLINASSIVFSGSLPSEISDGYKKLLQITQSYKRPLVTFLDTYGDPLLKALEVNPTYVKINAAEASITVKYPVDSIDTAFQAGMDIHDMGASVAIITLGERGAIAVSNEKSWYAAIPPSINTVGCLGCGDAFLGGFVLELRRQKSLEYALRKGVAAGAANALTYYPGVVDKKKVEKLMKKVQLIQL